MRNERAMLFPTESIANSCRAFIQNRSSQSGQAFSARLVYLDIRPEDKVNKDGTEEEGEKIALLSSAPVDLHIVLFPSEAAGYAKEFWQHTGMGISSRLAEHCLSILPTAESAPEATRPTSVRYGDKRNSKHYSAKRLSKPPSPQDFKPALDIDDLTSDHSAYLEERYGRNMPLSLAASAKRAMRRRISGTLLRDENNGPCAGDVPCAGEPNAEVGPSTRGVAEVSEDDVYLYPTGMSAIWNAHNLARNTRPLTKSICFGYVLKGPFSLRSFTYLLW
jgi:cystathionine gamma-synthase